MDLMLHSEHFEEYLLAVVDSVACLQALVVVAFEYLDPFAASVHSSVDFHSFEVAALVVLVVKYAVAKKNHLIIFFIKISFTSELRVALV